MAIEKEDESQIEEDWVELVKQWEVCLLKKRLFCIERAISTSKMCHM